MLSFKQTKLPSTESGKHILILEADARECSALMSYFSLKYKGENEKKKLFLMSTLAAVPGQLSQGQTNVAKLKIFQLGRSCPMSSELF